MTLPASLLAAVEQHACFTGCYKGESEVQVCVDPSQPPMPAVPVCCSDCLLFHPSALASLLPLGMTSYALASTLTTHVRTLRGYKWSTGGYHTAGGGFWINAVYYGNGLFLVDASRNRNSRTDTETLIEAFRHNVVQPEDPGMMDPALYTSQLAYVNMAQPITNVQSKQDLLASTQCSTSPKQLYSRVSIVEFQPLVVAAGSTSGATLSTAGPTEATTTEERARPLALGERCPKCGAEVKERPLFSGTFVGCLC